MYSAVVTSINPVATVNLVRDLRREELFFGTRMTGVCPNLVMEINRRRKDEAWPIVHAGVRSALKKLVKWCHFATTV